MENPATISEWKGVRIDKMPRKELEREFIAIVLAYVIAPLEAFKPKPSTLDPQTARVLNEVRGLCSAIEAGTEALREFSDNIIDDAGLQRRISVRTTYIPPKPKAQIA